MFAWYYEEMHGIDPLMVQHEIKNYKNAKPIWKKLRPLNPSKETTIKSEVEKLLKPSFI